MRESAKLKYLNKTDEFPLWEFAGPTNIGGRIADIEFDPQNPNIIYAGAATGGVFKSTDTGANWFPVFDDQPILTIGDIGIDPSNPLIIYAGTGEPNGGHNNFNGGGIFKSTDGGETWNFAGLENTSSIGRIVIDPVNTSNVYVAAVGSYFGPNPERGIYKSTNGGQSWENVLFVSDSTGAIDIVVNPKNPEHILAAMWERVRRPNDSHLYGPSGGIFKSTNGGRDWKKLGPETGLPDPALETIGRIGLAHSRNFPDIIYSYYNDGTKYTGLYKSTNSGDNWIKIDPEQRSLKRGINVQLVFRTDKSGSC